VPLPDICIQGKDPIRVPNSETNLNFEIFNPSASFINDLFLALNMTLNLVIEGINKAPLRPSVRKRAIQTLKDSNFEEVWTIKAQYEAPETLDHVKMAESAMGIITPVLAAKDVDQARGRDTYRRIYVALGGKRTVQYETK